MTHRIAWTAVLLAALPSLLQAQGVLTGVVVDATERSPVAGAEVRILDVEGRVVASTLATEAGEFRFDDQDPGLYSLQVTRVGYAALTAEAIPLVAGDETHVEVRLGVDAVALEPVVVVAPEVYRSARLREFDARAERAERVGRGRIYTRDDIERLRPIFALDLLQTYQWRGGCQPVVLLDGLPADDSLTYLRAADIEGVEIYRGLAQIPGEYYQVGMCGLVMFWTRPDPPGLAPVTWRRVATAGAVLLLIGATSVVF